MPNIYDNPESLLKPSDAWKVCYDDYMYSKKELVDPMVDKWKEWDELYRCYVESEDDDILSNLCYPLAFSHVETFLPRLVANRPRIEVNPREPGDDLRAAQNMALQFYHWDALRMPWQIVNFVKSAQIRGTAFFRVTYRKEMHTRRFRRSFGLGRFMSAMSAMNPMSAAQETQMRWITKKVETWNGPWIELLEIDQCFPHPSARHELEDYPFIIRSKVAIDSLEAAQRDGKPLYSEKVMKQLRELTEGNNPRMLGETQTLWENLRSKFGPENIPSVDEHRREVHILERETNGKRTTIIEEFPQLEPILNERNELGMKSVVGYRPTPVPNEMYGIGKPEILSSINLEMNSLGNARMDHLMMSVHPMFEILLGSNINPAQMQWRPRGHFFSAIPNGMRAVQLPPVDFAHYREQQNLDQLAQKATGGTDTFAGMRSANTGKTATEANLLSEAAGSRAGLEFQLLGYSLADLAKLIIRIDETYWDKKKRIRVLGDRLSQLPNLNGLNMSSSQGPEGDKDEIEIDPEVLASGSGVDLDVIIDIAGTEPQTRQFKLQQAMAAVQTLGSIGLPLDDPFMERRLIEIEQGFGDVVPDKMIARHRELVEMERQMGPQGRAQQFRQGTNPSNMGEVLAATGGAQTPSTGDFQG